MEEQNAEYREKLVRTIRERDLNDELLKNVRDETKNELEELKRKIRDYEIQLKAVQVFSLFYYLLELWVITYGYYWFAG